MILKLLIEPVIEKYNQRLSLSYFPSSVELEYVEEVTEDDDTMIKSYLIREKVSKRWIFQEQRTFSLKNREEANQIMHEAQEEILVSILGMAMYGTKKLLNEKDSD